MFLNLKKIGLLILTAGIIILAVFIFRPDSDNDNIVPSEHEERNDQIVDKNVLLESETLNAGNFFAEYRLERERVRGRQIEMLTEVLNNSLLKEAQPEAALRLVQISTDMEKELQTEGVIKSKGFDDCVAIIQAETALIVIREDNKSRGNEEDIIEIAERITGYGADQISIIFREQ